MGSLGTDPRVLALARQLGLRTRGDPVAALKQFALDKVRSFIEGSGFGVESLETLRHLVADRLSVSIEFLRTDADVARVAEEFGDYYRSLDALLDDEFLKKKTEGLLLRHPNPHPGEHRYLAIVDARDEQTPRAYFTAWHELAHLLVDPPQQSFKFRATPSRDEIRKDPVESVVDAIAGILAFYGPIFDPVLQQTIEAHGGLNFRAIESARSQVAPDASLLSAAFAATSRWPEPVGLLVVQLEYKKAERRQLRSSQREMFARSLAELPQPRLRAVNVILHGEDNPLKIRKNMRVPPGSVLTRLFEEGADGDTAEASEDQGWWETSATGHLPRLPLRVSAIRRGSYVYGLVFLRDENR
ncbi:MAG: hypothetical protein SCH98_12095 [Deferrisomatales bacterium]|nr:hypothetical protein [Deferrisomatales bacterium]